MDSGLWEFFQGIPAWEIADSLSSNRRFEPRMIELQRGDRVAVHILFRGHDMHGVFRQTELVWLKVQEVGESWHLGVLEKNPVQSPALQAGNLVEFECRHVSLYQMLAPRFRGPFGPRFRSRIFRRSRRRRGDDQAL